MRNKTVRVFEVLYCVSDDHPSAHGGAAGDGSFIARFRKQSDAESFARGKLCYGRQASVEPIDAPRHLAQRWGVL